MGCLWPERKCPREREILKIQKERAIKIDHDTERHCVVYKGRQVSLKQEMGLVCLCL